MIIKIYKSNKGFTVALKNSLFFKFVPLKVVINNEREFISFLLPNELKNVVFTKEFIIHQIVGKRRNYLLSLNNLEYFSQSLVEYPKLMYEENKT